HRGDGPLRDSLGRRVRSDLRRAARLCAGPRARPRPRRRPLVVGSVRGPASRGPVDDPGAVTIGQMNGWAAGFDSWAICDTVCFHLFDRTPHAWARVRAWSNARGLFVRRAAFALLWGLTVHDRVAADRAFLDCLPLIETGALDQRDLVKKAVDMSLRALGKRNQTLRRAAVELATRLARSSERSQAWIGRSALRELARRNDSEPPSGTPPAAAG